MNEVRALVRARLGGVGQCVAQKKASLSPACETIVTQSWDRGCRTNGSRGMPVYSSDDKALGQVAQVA